MLSIKNSRKIVLTGGGTAGHVMPNVALLPMLEKQFDEIHYIGSHTGIERDIISKFPHVKYHEVDTAKLRRSLNIKSMLSNAKTPIKVIRGVRQSKKILQQIKPDVIFSKGGFVGYPVVRAGAKLNIRVIIHESDMTMGLANRMSVKYCDVICTSFEKTATELAKKNKDKKVVWTGTPIRKEILQRDAAPITDSLSLESFSTNKKNLLVMGGSLGASAINSAVRDTLGELCKEWNVLHITGKGKKVDLDNASLDFSTSVEMTKCYIQVEFMDEIWHAMNWADVIVSRAGSNALCEILALGKPCVFVPLATGRGDQIDNAKEIERVGAGIVLQESELNNESLVQSIKIAYDKRNDLAVKSKEFVKLDADREIIKILGN